MPTSGLFVQFLICNPSYIYGVYTMSNGINQVSADQVYQSMQNNEDFLLIDCREQMEWDMAHIEKSEFFPLSEAAERYSELPKDKKIIIVCRTGRRSQNLCEFLKNKGYNDVNNFAGGIVSWVSSGYDTIN